ncbi:MAG: c-type cytochrome [Pseudohongiellaceae bacterium]
MNSITGRFFPMIVAISMLMACGDGGGSGVAEPVELTRVQGFMADPAALERGEALFVGTCAGYCHSFEGPNADALYLFDCEWKHGAADENIFNTVTTGIPNTRMVGFGTNFPEGEDDLWKIIAYLRSQQETC